MALIITQTDVARIRAHGEVEFPDECCGFVLGSDTAKGKQVSEIVPVSNLQVENRARRFMISPEQYLAAERHARGHGLELLGFYHSHPDHPAIPSEFDREHALPYYSYLIVSVNGGSAAELRSWLLSEDRTGYAEEHIRITGISTNKVTG